MKIQRWKITSLDEDGPCKCIGHMMDVWSTGEWVMWKDVEPCLMMVESLRAEVKSRTDTMMRQDATIADLWVIINERGKRIAALEEALGGAS